MVLNYYFDAASIIAFVMLIAMVVSTKHIMLRILKRRKIANMFTSTATAVTFVIPCTDITQRTNCPLL